MWVIDSSATANWLLDDESDDRVNQVFDEVVVCGADAPSLWP